MLGIAEGLSYLTLSLGAVVLTLQVGNPVANLLHYLLLLVLAADVQHVCLDVQYLGKHLLSGGALVLSAYLLPCSLNGSCIPLVWCKKHILETCFCVQVKNYGYIPSVLPDSKCYGDPGPKSPKEVTKALSEIFSTSEAPRLSASSASDSAYTSAEAPFARAIARGVALDLADGSTDSVSASPAGMIRLGAAGISGTAATEVPKVVHQPTPVPKQGA